MPSKFDELRRKAQQTARDLDEKYKITSKLDEGARKTTDALRKGADVATSTIDSARQEAQRDAEAHMEQLQAQLPASDPTSNAIKE